MKKSIKNQVKKSSSKIVKKLIIGTLEVIFPKRSPNSNLTSAPSKWKKDIILIQYRTDSQPMIFSMIHLPSRVSSCFISVPVFQGSPFKLAKKSSRKIRTRKSVFIIRKLDANPRELAKIRVGIRKRNKDK